MRYLLGLLLLSATFPLFNCICEIEDDFEDNACLCPDLTKLDRSETTDAVFSKKPDCTYSITCSQIATCNGTEYEPLKPCGYIMVRQENFPYYIVPGNWDFAYLFVVIDRFNPVNIVDALDFKCENGSWYIDKFPYGIYYEILEQPHGVIIPPEQLVGVRAKIDINDSHLWCTAH